MHTHTQVNSSYRVRAANVVPGYSAWPHRAHCQTWAAESRRLAWTRSCSRCRLTRPLSPHPGCTHACSKDAHSDLNMQICKVFTQWTCIFSHWPLLSPQKGVKTIDTRVLKCAVQPHAAWPAVLRKSAGVRAAASCYHVEIFNAQGRKKTTMVFVYKVYVLWEHFKGLKH